jgi:hypothetical protein
MSDRLQKQLVIGLGYLILLSGIVYGLFIWVRVEPTCFDHVQNGQEEGVDCGTVACGTSCAPAILPLEVMDTQLFPVREGEYDFMARIRNTNLLYGAAQVPYTLILKDAQGVVLALETGKLYVLPAQTRYLIRTSLRGAIATVGVQLGEVSWAEVNATDLKVDFPLRRESFMVAKTPGAAQEYEGIIFNNSDFDFAKVDIAVIVRDATGAIIGANTTDVRTLPSRSDRYFKVTWPQALGKNLTAQVEATTNVFENSNFIKRYGTQEQFQQF